MKKTVSQLLAAALILSLACLWGCATSTPQAIASPAASTPAPAATEAPPAPEGPTKEDLKNSKPNEYVQEKLAAGQKVLIGCSMVADVPVLMQVWAGQITDVIKPLGFDWVINAAGGDTGVMISQIENYVTMGAAAIIMVPPDKDSLREAIIKAQDAGTYVIIFGIQGVDYCFATRSDPVENGKQEAKMASAWAKMVHPDATAGNPVLSAVLYSSNVADAQLGGETLASALDETDNCDVVFIDDSAKGSIDGGYEFAQNALAFNPDIRVFVCLQGVDGVGMSNYVMAQPGLDYSKYAAFCQLVDTAANDLILDYASADKAILRGSIEQKEAPGTALANTTLKALYGEIKSPYDYLIPSFALVQSGWDYTASF